MLQTFRALAEPSRLQIVNLLRDGPLQVGEVADVLGIRQPQASKHLRVLSESGLVEVRADAQRRICALRAAPLRGLDQWLDRFRNLWVEQCEKLDDLLAEEQATGGRKKKRKKK